MPFQSEKQRRYLWANEPEIAREWTDRYGARGGGIMRVPLANGSFNTNLLRDYLQNDPLRNIYNLDPSVIKSYEQDLSPRAAEAAKDAIGYTRPYGDDPNLFIKDLDKFGMQPTGPLYGAPIMDTDFLESKAYRDKAMGVDKFGNEITRPQTYRELMTSYLNAPEGSYKRDFATQGMIEDNPTITERNKQIGETIGHEARHQLLADNPEFYEDIDDSLVANIGATGTDKHEILNRMLDFQAYNDPGAYEDIYEDMHGDMPRHLSSPIADKFSEQATAFTDKMLQPYQKPKYSPQWDFPGSDLWGNIQDEDLEGSSDWGYSDAEIGKGSKFYDPTHSRIQSILNPIKKTWGKYGKPIMGSIMGGIMNIPGVGLLMNSVREDPYAANRIKMYGSHRDPGTGFMKDKFGYNVGTTLMKNRFLEPGSNSYRSYALDAMKGMEKSGRKGALNTYYQNTYKNTKGQPMTWDDVKKSHQKKKDPFNQGVDLGADTFVGNGGSNQGGGYNHPGSAESRASSDPFARGGLASLWPR